MLHRSLSSISYHIRSILYFIHFPYYILHSFISYLPSSVFHLPSSIAFVASRALGLRMKVVAFDPFLTAERAIEICRQVFHRPKVEALVFGSTSATRLCSSALMPPIQYSAPSGSVTFWDPKDRCFGVQFPGFREKSTRYDDFTLCGILLQDTPIWGNFRSFGAQLGSQCVGPPLKMDRKAQKGSRKWYYLIF